MKPAARWAIAVAIVILLAILLWLWNPFGQKAESPGGDAAEQTSAPTPAPAPVTPAPKEPVTAVVLFDFDRAVLRPAEAARLDELSARFKDGGFDRIDAVGYADRIGRDAYNMSLSARRAEAVRGNLAGSGIDRGKIDTDAKGESEQVTGAECRNMGSETRKNRKLIECLQPDRRVQITLVPAR